MMTGIVYDSYMDYVQSMCSEDNLTNFKSSPKYTRILEHLSAEEGLQYLECILTFTKMSLDDINSFCAINDKIGNPRMHEYSFGKASPTSLRYVFHSHLILSYMKSIHMDTANIVEVGGGYGGLCLALYHFAHLYDICITNYTIIDLPEIIALQNMYHTRNNLNGITYINADSYGKDITARDCFLISNYCFSEIQPQHQLEYIKYLFPKIAHGFMCWNFHNVYNFGFEMTVVDEYPCTCTGNKYVYF